MDFVQPGSLLNKSSSIVASLCTKFCMMLGIIKASDVRMVSLKIEWQENDFEIDSEMTQIILSYTKLSFLARSQNEHDINTMQAIT